MGRSAVLIPGIDRLPCTSEKSKYLPPGTIVIMEGATVAQEAYLWEHTISIPRFS